MASAEMGNSVRFDLGIFGLVLLSVCVKLQAAPALFVFGDSLVDSGNNNYIASIARADRTPYGIDYSDHTPTGRFSNGKIIPDFIAERMGLRPILPYLDPSLQGDRLLEGANFASAGIGILNDTGIQFAATISIPRQFEYFSDYQHRVAAIIGRRATDRLIAESLVLITVGGNDYVNNYYFPGSQRPRQYTVSQYTRLLVTEYSKQLTRLYELGARKIVVTGAGPLGCLPVVLASTRSRNGECDQPLQQAAIQYNALLKSRIGDLNARFRDATFVFAALMNTKSEFLSRPQAYGFETAKVACCGQGAYNGVGLCSALSQLCPDRTKYAFWDAYHTTEKGNMIIADEFMGGRSSSISPVNVNTLMGL